MKNQNQIQQFHNEEFGSLDILMIDDKPYFPATECARVLGYKNPRDAISKHCRVDGVAKRDGVSPKQRHLAKITKIAKIKMTR